MPEEIIARYRIELDKLKGDVNELKKQFGLAESAASESAKKSSASFGQLGAQLKTLGVTLLAAFSVQKIIAFGEASIKAFQEAEKNARKLQIAVGVNGGLQADFEHLLQQSKELQARTIFSDDAIQQMQTMALQFGLSADAVERLTPTILDFASATDQDLNSAMQGFILGVEGSERALKKYGIQVDNQATRQENFAAITEQLNKKFSGQAELLGKTSVGAIARLKNNFDELKETIGETLIPFASAAVESANALLKMAEVPLSETLQKEQQDFRASRIELLALNVGSDERIRIIKELQSKYPELLANVRAETATNEELRDVLEKINDQYIFKIALAKGKETLQPILEDEAEAALKASEAQTALANEIDKIIQQAEKYPSANNKRIKSDLEYLPVLEQGRLLAEGRVKFDAISSSSLTKLAAAYDEAKKTQIDYSDATIKADDAQKEFNKTTAALKDIFKQNDAVRTPKATGLEKLTPEEQAKIDALARARADAERKAAEEAGKVREELRKQELTQDEENVKLEVANRLNGLETVNVTEKQMAITLTQIELFELTSRLQNYKDYGENVGDVLIQIANKNRELQKIMATPGEEMHPNAEDFAPIKKFYKDWDDLEADKKKQLLADIQEIGDGFAQLAIGFTQINQDRITAQMDQNRASAEAEEADLKEQFDQRIIGNEEYEKKLQAIKDKREGNEKALQDRLRKLRNRQALFEKAQTIFDIGLKTREAVMGIVAKYSATPPLEFALIALTVALAAGQLGLALSLNPPTAHTGEKFVKRKGDSRFGLKPNETIRTLEVGERVFDKYKNRKHWSVFEAIDDGRLEDYIFHRFVTPALIAQNKSKEARSQKSFAENIANSFLLNSSSTGLGDDREFHKMWNRGIRITNLGQLANMLSSTDNPYRKI